MSGDRTERGLGDTIPDRTRRTVNVAERLSDAEIARPVDLDANPIEDLDSDASRYQALGTIGEGGMGEVRLCLDRRIGREVAMKVIQRDQGSFSDAKLRFFREARVQGQLEHPAVVPVHDLGVGPDGPYFTMKRIRGLTLEDVLVALAEGDPDAQRAYPLRRLLTAMSTVCLAVAFAHSRGVIHRDLKPANVMLGAFGEVHVLDWGVAKLAGATEGARPIVDVPKGESGKTAVGEMMGTPGYMAPEQAMGTVEGIDGRTDVYALGAILFEVLTLKPLHAGDSVPELVASTLRGADAWARARAPERAIAAELEALCVRATALLPADRHASARALAEAIDRFLDGTLDSERRAAMAEAHARASLAATESALAKGDEHARRTAMREAGAALALNPGEPTALEALARLLLSPPEIMPKEAQAEYDAQVHIERSAARGPLFSYLGWLAFLPIVFLLGVRDVTLAAMAVVAVLAAGAAAFAAYKLDAGPRAKLGVYLLGSIVVLLSSTLMGPFILVPNLAVTNALAFVLYGDRRHRVASIAIAGLGVTLPFVAQLLGWLPSSYAFTDQGMTILPHLADLPRAGTLALLFIASLALVIPPSIFAARVHDEVNEGQRRAFLHAWNLRQLLPEGARAAGAGR